MTKMASDLTRDAITIPPTKTTLSSFLSIGNSHPTTTIKVQKLLSKTIQRRNNKTVKNTPNGANENNNDNKKNKNKRPIISSPKRSGFKALFGNKKRESPLAKTKEVSGNWEGKGKQPVGYDNDKKIFEQPKNKCKGSIKIPAFLVGIFDRKSSFTSTEVLRSKLCCSSSITSRIPRFSITSREIKKNDDMENEETSGEGELCKKRILMGEKCKPLNSSGILHYDEKGVLLPEYEA